MTVPVVLAIAGVVTLVIGVLGGGIKAKEIEIPSMPASIRIFASLAGLILIGVSIWLSSPGTEKGAQVVSPTSPPPTSIQTDTSANPVFTLTNAKPEDFYILKSATFVLRSDGKLAIGGKWSDGIYLNQPLPSNFRATVQFRIESPESESPEDEFILGLSNGREMRPNYHFVMGYKRIAFKQQLGFDITDGWDNEIESTTIANYLLRPNLTYEIEIERRNGGINILINNGPVFVLGAQDVQDIGKFNYLYLTGAIQQQIIIERLIIERLE